MTKVTCKIKYTDLFYRFAKYLVTIILSGQKYRTKFPFVVGIPTTIIYPLSPVEQSALHRIKTTLYRLEASRYLKYQGILDILKTLITLTSPLRINIFKTKYFYEFNMNFNWLYHNINTRAETSKIKI